jgi:hypothetical protein
MRDVIPQNIKDALQDLPDGLQQQVFEYLESLEPSAPPSLRGRGRPCFDVSAVVRDLRDLREDYGVDFE